MPCITDQCGLLVGSRVNSNSNSERVSNSSGCGFVSIKEAVSSAITVDIGTVRSNVSVSAREAVSSATTVGIGTGRSNVGVSAKRAVSKAMTVDIGTVRSSIGVGTMSVSWHIVWALC